MSTHTPVADRVERVITRNLKNKLTLKQWQVIDAPWLRASHRAYLKFSPNAAVLLIKPNISQDTRIRLIGTAVIALYMTIRSQRVDTGQIVVDISADSDINRFASNFFPENGVQVARAEEILAWLRESDAIPEQMMRYRLVMDKFAGIDEISAAMLRDVRSHARSGVNLPFLGGIEACAALFARHYYRRKNRGEKSTRKTV